MNDFIEANKEVEKLAKQIINEHHPHLRGVLIRYHCAGFGKADVAQAIPAMHERRILFGQTHQWRGAAGKYRG